MPTPLETYRSYHTNPINIGIHQVCVPLLLATWWAVVPFPVALLINGFYTFSYLAMEITYTNSRAAACALQILFVAHLPLRWYLSPAANVALHVVSWVAQVVGHRVWEANHPALLDNLVDSLLLAPYFVFLEGYNPASLHRDPPAYTLVMGEKGDPTRPTIVYFGGMFQKSQRTFGWTRDKNALPNYNHIYVNMYWRRGDSIRARIEPVVADIHAQLAQHGDSSPLAAWVGFSFGGALARHARDQWCTLTKQHRDHVPCFLVSPGGFRCHTSLTECLLEDIVSPWFDSWYHNDRTYLVSKYPLYEYAESDTLGARDAIVTSRFDTVHGPSRWHPLKQTLDLRYAFHSTIVDVVRKQRLLSQWLEAKYEIGTVQYKPLTSPVQKWLFGSYFKLHVIGWVAVSTYSLLDFVARTSHPLRPLVEGFFVASTLWTLTEYAFHRWLLHGVAHAHHHKHHQYPNKRSLIHTPMSLVVANGLLYRFVLPWVVSRTLLDALVVFFPLLYLSFEATHYMTHSYTGDISVLVNTRQYHKLHHQAPMTNYSFLTPLWDWLCGTLHPAYPVTAWELWLGMLPFYSFAMHPRQLVTPK